MMPDAVESIAAEEAETIFHGQGEVPPWLPGLRDLVEVLEQHAVDHVFIGGLASLIYGRPRATQDLDVLVAPLDARPVLEALERRGYVTDERAPHWLFKASGNGAEIDIIFQAVGEMYLDDGMLDRSRSAYVHETPVRIVGPEDLLVMKALAHREHSPRHWFDALALIANGELDWDIVADLGSIRPRRVLSLLLYATSVDLRVPADVIDQLYRATGASGGSDS
jgi:predicted nucleotidyltransferase